MVIVKVSVDVAPAGMVLGENDLVNVGTDGTVVVVPQVIAMLSIPAIEGEEPAPVKKTRKIVELPADAAVAEIAWLL